MEGYPDDTTGTKNLTHSGWTRENFDIETHNIGYSVEELKEALSDDTETCAMICAAGNAFKDNKGRWRYSAGHFVAVVGYDEEGFHVSDSAYSEADGTDVIYDDSEMKRMLAGARHVTIYEN